MSNFLTVSPDELEVLAAIPADARVLVYSPGGPLQAIAHDQLLAKLIAADLVKPSEAVLKADLAHPENAVALVINDPVASKNGWWRKIGDAGAGDWDQFEELTKTAREAAAASAASAEQSAAELEQALSDVASMKVRIANLEEAAGIPVFTADPSIVGTAEVGQTVSLVDGTVIGGAITSRVLRRGVSVISTDPGETYTIEPADIGENLFFANGATGAGGVSEATSAAFGPVVDPAPFVFPALSTAKYDGDSRTEAAGGRSNSSGSLTITTGGQGAGGASFITPLAGNKWLLTEGYQHAIGGSTTRAQEERAQSTTIAATGNPAETDTGNINDAEFSVGSDGVSTILTQAGSHIFSTSVGVNDNSGSSAAFYNDPETASQTLATIARIADAIGAAGKVWYVGNECPRGDSFYSMEQQAVSSGSCAAANTTNFVDGESFGAVGCVGVFASGLPRALTKVASAPGQDEYTVDASGVYTFGGSAPVTAYLNYNASPAGGRTATYGQLRIVKEFMESEDANFVSAVNSVDYGIPGLRHNRPWVRVVDTFGALLDPASGADQLPVPGTFDSLQLHTLGLGYGAYLLGKAFADAVAADYPSAPDRSTAPTRNNWYAARGSGATATYSGTLPVTMRTGFTTTPAPTIISVDAAVIGSVNTSTGEITGTGIASGNLDFTTGAWTITFDTTTTLPVNNELWFEQDIGNFDIATLNEGTIGRNAVMNGLLDMTPADGGNLPNSTGTSSITGIADSEVPYGYTLSSNQLDAAIVAETVEASVIAANDADGFPIFQIDCRGSHTSNIIPTLSAYLIRDYATRTVPGDQLMAGALIRYASHGTEGVTYGNEGAQLNMSFATEAVSRSSPSGPADVTQVLNRVSDRSPGTYFDQQIANAEGGEFDAYRCTAMVDTTGMVFGNNIQVLSWMGRGPANLPFAFRMGTGRMQLRRRNDVS